MNYEEAIKSIWRHSKEASTSEEASILREIVRYATLAPSGHNTQCWRFRIEDLSITILPDFSRRTPVVDPDDHHLYVSLGCAIENPRPGRKSVRVRGAIGIQPRIWRDRSCAGAVGGG